MFIIEHSIMKTSNETVALILGPHGWCRYNVIGKIPVLARDGTPITECIACHCNNLSVLILSS